MNVRCDAQVCVLGVLFLVQADRHGVFSCCVLFACKIKCHLAVKRCGIGWWQNKKTARCRGEEQALAIKCLPSDPHTHLFSLCHLMPPCPFPCLQDEQGCQADAMRSHRQNTKNIQHTVSGCSSQSTLDEETEAQRGQVSITVQHGLPAAPVHAAHIQNKLAFQEKQDQFSVVLTIIATTASIYAEYLLCTSSHTKGLTYSIVLTYILPTVS